MFPSFGFFFSTKIELVLIEERKHEEQSNKHDNKKCENKKNSFRGDLHS
jgi:hypothetical protein